MEKIYQAVLQAFKNKEHLFTSQGIPAPAYMDLYEGQPENPEYFEFNLPAVFIDYQIQWQQEGNLYQGNVVLYLHCIPEEAPPTDNISPLLNKGLDTVRFYNTIRQVLDGLKGENFSEFIRFDETRQYTENFKYHILTYTCTLSQQDNEEVDKYIPKSFEEVSLSGRIKTHFRRL